MDTNTILLTHLKITKFEPYIRDLQATEATQHQYNTAPRAARVNKRRYPEYALKAVASADRAARATHNRLTIPWFDDGTRALPASQYIPYTQAMNEAKTVFMRAVEQFLAQEPTLRAQDAMRLGQLYREDDYPDHDSLRDCFSFEVAISMVPEINDIRFDLADHEREALKTQLETQMTKAHEQWANDLAARLYKQLSRLTAKLHDPEGIFKDKTLLSLRDIVDIMRDLNVMDDPNISAFADEIANKVAHYEPDDLRINKDLRAKVAREAQQVVDQLKGLYNMPS